jgi:hypothetical protein
MPNPPILRTHCSVAYSTPAGGSTLNLGINCAAASSGTWPWKYFWTKTIGSGNTRPVTTNATQEAGGSFNIDGDSDEGQVVLRGIFAYIATDPLSATIKCTAKMIVTQSTPPTNTANYALIARLYEPNGSLISSFFDENAQTKETTVTLPATVCPKVLWVGALVQPRGPLPFPSCQASISVSVT